MTETPETREELVRWLESASDEEIGNRFAALDKQRHYDPDYRKRSAASIAFESLADACWHRYLDDVCLDSESTAFAIKSCIKRSVTRLIRFEQAEEHIRPIYLDSVLKDLLEIVSCQDFQIKRLQAALAAADLLRDEREV